MSQTTEVFTLVNTSSTPMRDVLREPELYYIVDFSDGALPRSPSIVPISTLSLSDILGYVCGPVLKKTIVAADDPRIVPIQDRNGNTIYNTLMDGLKYFI